MTRRTSCSLPDSSRTPDSEMADRKAALRLSCSGVNTFLPAFSLATGLEQASISDITVAVDTPGGSSVMTRRHWPRASGSIFHLARTRRLPRPVR